MSKTHEEHSTKGFVEDQRDFFDRLITQDWHTYKDTQWDRTRQLEVDALLRRLPEAKRILNVGCGCGYQDLLFACVQRIQHIVGIDYSEKSILTAEREYSHEKIQRKVVDILSQDQRRSFLGEIGGTFDLVVSFQVIEHLMDPEDFLDACIQCAREDGAIAMVTPNALRLQNRYNMLFNKPLELIDPLHYREYSLVDLKTLGRKKGLNLAGYFGHSAHLNLGGHSIIRSGTKAARALSSAFPGLSDVIGVIFRR